MGIKRKIIAHLVMWSLIAAGVFFAFSFFPAEIIFPGQPFYFKLIAILLGIIFLYYFISAIILRFSAILKKRDEWEIVKMGVYGRLAHPTCMSAVFLSWIIFFLYSDFRILISDAYMTVIIICWIGMEKSFFRKNGPPKLDEPEVG